MTTPMAAVVGLACPLTAAPAVVSANVGESLAQAKGRSADYRKRYGAVALVFKRDAAGRIAMECWAAPPEQETKAHALILGTELLPATLRAAIPRALPQDGTEETFVWTDGTRLILFKRRGRYDQFEVSSKDYAGGGC